MQNKEVLQISPLQMRIMREVIRIGKVGNRISRRVQAIVMFGEGYSGYRINKMLGFHSDCIARWKQRWQENSLALDELEGGIAGGEIKEKEVKEGILDILSDLPRSGAPARITMEQKNQIVALACEQPCKYGIPFTHWTLEALSKVALETSIVQTITAAYVGVILRKKNSNHIKQATGFSPRYRIGISSKLK